MIIDSLQNLSLYQGLNPYFPEVVAFLQKHPLEELPLGKTVIGEHAFINIVESPVRSKEEARLETHNRMIDIQLPISASEEHGYAHRARLPEATYDDANDISFYEAPCDGYVVVRPGQFVIYFPQDGHAPAITPVGLKKAIVKVEYVDAR
ncbi:MAG: YhcH/YjgK/YiaL family protein [Bacteroidaceae bacterium]|nr:YhcH/YjgK/YiaL family protein [Bacteroidaceae bacterium]